jgi:hypothetical protein
MELVTISLMGRAGHLLGGWEQLKKTRERQRKARIND